MPAVGARTRWKSRSDFGLGGSPKGDISIRRYQLKVLESDSVKQAKEGDRDLAVVVLASVTVDESREERRRSPLYCVHP